MGQSIPLVLPGLGQYQGGVSVFLSNDRVDEADILCGSLQLSTRGRMGKAASGDFASDAA